MFVMIWLLCDIFLSWSDEHWMKICPWSICLSNFGQLSTHIPSIVGSRQESWRTSINIQSYANAIPYKLVRRRWWKTGAQNWNIFTVGRSKWLHISCFFHLVDILHSDVDVLRLSCEILFLQLFDHGIDSLNCVLGGLIQCAAIGTGQSWYSVFIVVVACWPMYLVSVHFSFFLSFFFSSARCTAIEISICGWSYFLCRARGKSFTRYVKFMHS